MARHVHKREAFRYAAPLRMTAGDGIFETNTQCIGVENPTAFGKIAIRVSAGGQGLASGVAGNVC